MPSNGFLVALAYGIQVTSSPSQSPAAGSAGPKGGKSNSTGVPIAWANAP